MAKNLLRHIRKEEDALVFLRGFAPIHELAEHDGMSKIPLFLYRLPMRQKEDPERSIDGDKPKKFLAQPSKMPLGP